jgi:hypothetical protein
MERLTSVISNCLANAADLEPATLPTARIADCYGVRKRCHPIDHRGSTQRRQLPLRLAQIHHFLVQTNQQAPSNIPLTLLWCRSRLASALQVENDTRSQSAAEYVRASRIVDQSAPTQIPDRTD